MAFQTFICPLTFGGVHEIAEAVEGLGSSYGEGSRGVDDEDHKALDDEVPFGIVGLKLMWYNNVAFMLGYGGEWYQIRIPRYIPISMTIYMTDVHMRVRLTRILLRLRYNTRESCL